ncbi:hypothetical protein [Streptococcus loxodontisalivarius]|uniref:Uncharacterized protein n=1 Tax=Streptococcus loxodontisalivarius TaxID=1349415 RepID=A0ABS2PRY4_9STRE|nr:hypothetical protein [Streptococcus loxodontisalivarius]MBM7642804.1 hypothetical protein [Streptococcus loxodontisalivarius]
MEKWVVVDQFGNEIGGLVFYNKQDAEEYSKNIPYTSVQRKFDLP